MANEREFGLPKFDIYDFKEQARALIKRLGQNPGAPLNQGLALIAAETALREAYARGQKDTPAGKARAASSAPGVSGSQGRTSFGGKAPARGKPSAPVDERPRECAHEWEELYLDERHIGAKCYHCGISQRDVQERCDHYFVDTGMGDVCVACRKPRGKASR